MGVRVRIMLQLAHLALGVVDVLDGSRHDPLRLVRVRVRATNRVR